MNNCYPGDPDYKTGGGGGPSGGRGSDGPGDGGSGFTVGANAIDAIKKTLDLLNKVKGAGKIIERLKLQMATMIATMFCSSLVPIIGPIFTVIEIHSKLKLVVCLDVIAEKIEEPDGRTSSHLLADIPIFGDKDGFLAECNQECPVYLQPLCTIIMVQKQVVKNIHKVLDGLNVHKTLMTTNHNYDTDNYNNLRSLAMAIKSFE